MASPAATAVARRPAIDVLREAPWITRNSLLRGGIGLALVSDVLLANYFYYDAGRELGGDFITFFAGAKAAARGLASLAYDHQWFNAFLKTATRTAVYRTYDYPPLALLLCLPFALLPFLPALIAWMLLGAAACFALLRRLVGGAAAAVAVIGAPAVTVNLFCGQNGYWTAAFFAGGLMFLETRPVLAGICFAGLAYKPQMALMVPLALIAGRHWRALFSAAITLLALGLLTALLFGSGAWVGFFKDLMLFGTTRGPGAVPTVMAAFRSLGAAPAVADAAQLLSSLLAAVLIAVLWRSPAPAGIKNAALPVATFLATPYALPYDEVVLIFAAAWLGREGLRTGFLAWERLSILALLLLPLAAVAIGQTTGVQLSPIVLWPIMGLLVRRALADPAAPAVLAARM